MTQDDFSTVAPVIGCLDLGDELHRLRRLAIWRAESPSAARALRRGTIELVVRRRTFTNPYRTSTGRARTCPWQRRIVITLCTAQRVQWLDGRLTLLHEVTHVYCRAARGRCVAHDTYFQGMLLDAACEAYELRRADVIELRREVDAVVGRQYLNLDQAIMWAGHWRHVPQADTVRALQDQLGREAAGLPDTEVVR